MPNLWCPAGSTRSCFVAFGALSSGRPLPTRSGSLGTPGSAPSVKAKQVRTARPVGALLVATSATPRTADGSVWLLLEALTEAREAASSKAVTTASTPALPL